jgi:hypothetical protein
MATQTIHFPLLNQPATFHELFPYMWSLKCIIRIFKIHSCMFQHRVASTTLQHRVSTCVATTVSAQCCNNYYNVCCNNCFNTMLQQLLQHVLQQLLQHVLQQHKHVTTIIIWHFYLISLNLKYFWVDADCLRPKMLLHHKDIYLSPKIVIIIWEMPL